MLEPARRANDESQLSAIIETISRGERWNIPTYNIAMSLKAHLAAHGVVTRIGKSFGVFGATYYLRKIV